MPNVTFNRDSLKVSGFNRSPFPFEIEIRNVDAAGLTKIIQLNESRPKRDEEGNTLYLLPQPDQEEQSFQTIRSESAELTNEPCMILSMVQVPLMENGKQKSYQPIQKVDVLDEEGSIIGEEEIPIGPPLLLFTTHEELQQKKNEQGQLIYWQEKEIEETIFVPVAPLEIANNHLDYVEGLDVALEDFIQPKTVTIEEDMSEFNFEDIRQHKERQLIRKTFYSIALLFENMEDLFSDSLSGYNADLWTDRISFPPDGTARTIKLQLPQAAATIGLRLETSGDGLETEIGVLASELIPVDARNEVTFPDQVSEVYVRFTNSSDKRIDLFSFALLV
ncbi:hypothetical protein [Paenibacillus radicis (ex Xue et al. 2023)]|uniref:SLAP domain-containing protein n=1 Tax=Paenibacillus radicis (ex Xue et al. 2023) TaxID=2972489 RepID=A0ABT1YJX5_9BACL|nr:hypothetical protein [Paenibacillus radicis (ex Xue et al. 2023)]MCR8633498.1 hypothetical protein [Paenibacillus radicis (ex Xue et al. 2023)]